MADLPASAPFGAEVSKGVQSGVASFGAKPYCAQKRFWPFFPIFRCLQFIVNCKPPPAVPPSDGLSMVSFALLLIRIGKGMESNNLSPSRPGSAP
jgi:hypothetical protein